MGFAQHVAYVRCSRSTSARVFAAPHRRAVTSSSHRNDLKNRASQQQFPTRHSVAETSQSTRSFPHFSGGLANLQPRKRGGRRQRSQLGNARFLGRCSVPREPCGTRRLVAVTVDDRVIGLRVYSCRCAKTPAPTPADRVIVNALGFKYSDHSRCRSNEEVRARIPHTRAQATSDTSETAYQPPTAYKDRTPHSDPSVLRAHADKPHAARP